MSSNLTLCLLLIMCVVFGSMIIVLAIRVDYLTKKVNQLDTDIFEANIKIDHKYMNALDKIQKNQDLIENTIDHNSSVNKSLIDISAQNTAIIGQCKEILNKNIDICKFNEELQESCQKLLKMSAPEGIDISFNAEYEETVI